MKVRPHSDAVLSPMTPRLIAAIGLDDTLALLEKLGGTHLELRALKRDSHPLIREMGRAVAEKILEAFPGYRFIYLPMPDKLLARERNRRIAEAARSESYIALALRYRLTTRQVGNIVRQQRDEDDSGQGSLL